MPLSAEKSAAVLETRSLDDAGLQRFIAAAGVAQPGQGGRRSWNLTTLTLAAIYYHPDLDVARARLASARARIITAEQVPNPTLGLALSYNATTTVPSPWTIGPAINFLIETLALKHHRRAYAEELAEAARVDLEVVDWGVRSRVRSALGGLWAARGRLASSERRLGLQQELVRLLERRLAEGEASGFEVARERVARSQAVLAMADATREVADARASLAAAIGVPLATLEGAEVTFDAFDQVAILPFELATGSLRRAALLERADVRAVLREYAAAQALLQLEVARRFPAVTLGPGYTYDQGDDKYVLSLAVDLPLFNQNQGLIAEADARRQEIASRLIALQARIIASVDAAGASFDASTQALEAAVGFLAEEQRRADRATRSFEAGDADRPSLVASRLAVASAEALRFDALVRRMQAIGLLEDALQRPYLDAPAPLPDVEREPRAGAHRDVL